MVESTSLAGSHSTERLTSKSATLPSSPQSGTGSPQSTVSAPAMCSITTETSAADKRRENTKKIVFRLIGLGMDEEQLLQRNVDPGIIHECLQEHREKQRGSSVVSDMGHISLALSAPSDEEGEIVGSPTNVDQISSSSPRSPVVTAVMDNGRPVSPGVSNSIVISDESDEEGEVIEEEGLIQGERSPSSSRRPSPGTGTSSEEEGAVDMDTEGSESPPPVRQPSSYTARDASPVPHNRPSHHLPPPAAVHGPMGAANFPQYPHSYQGFPNAQMLMSPQYQQNAQMYLTWYAQRVLQNTASHYGQNVTAPTSPWAPHTLGNYGNQPRSRTTSAERPSPPSRENSWAQSTTSGSTKHSSTPVTPAVKDVSPPKDPRLELRGVSPTQSDPGVKVSQGSTVAKSFVRNTNNVQDFMLSDDDSDDADADQSNIPLDSNSTFVASNAPHPASGSTHRSSKVDPDAVEKARSLLAVQEQRIAEMKQRIQRMESSQKASPSGLASTTPTQKSLPGAANGKAASLATVNASPVREKSKGQVGPPRGFFARRVVPVPENGGAPISAPPRRLALSPESVNGLTVTKEPASLAASEAKLRQHTQYTKQLFDKYDEHLNIVSELRALLSQAARDLVKSQEAYEQANQKLDTLQTEVKEERAAWLRERQAYLAREVSPGNDSLPVVATLNSLKRKLGQLKESSPSPYVNPTETAVSSSVSLADSVASSEPESLEDVADTLLVTCHVSHDDSEPDAPPSKIQKLAPPTLESVAPFFVRQVKRWAKRHLVNDFGSYLSPVSKESALDLTVHTPNMEIPTDSVQWHQVSTIKPFHRIGGFLDYDHSRWLWPNDVFPAEELAERLGVHSTSEMKLDGSEADVLLNQVYKEHPFRKMRSDPEPTPPRSTRSLELQAKYRHAKSPSELKTMSVASKIDPMRPLCVFETSGGECRDSQCQSLHFRDLEASPEETLCELLQWNEGEGATEQQHFHNKLMKEMYFFTKEHPDASVDSAIDCVLNFRARYFRTKSLAMKSPEDMETADNTPSETKQCELALVGSHFMESTRLQRAFTQQYGPVDRYWHELTKWARTGIEAINSVRSRTSTPIKGGSSPPSGNSLLYLLAQAQNNTQNTGSCPWFSPCKDSSLPPDWESALIECVHKAYLDVRKIARKPRSLEHLYQRLCVKQFAVTVNISKGRYDVLPLIQAVQVGGSENEKMLWYRCVAMVWSAVRKTPRMLGLWLMLVDLFVGAAHESSDDLELAQSSKDMKKHMVTLFQYLLERFPYEPSLWWRYFCWEEHSQRKDRHLCQMLVHFVNMPMDEETFSHRRSQVLGTILVTLFQFRLSQLAEPQPVLDWFYNLLAAPSNDVVRQLLLVDLTQTKEFTEPPLLVLSTSSWIGKYLSPTVLTYVWTTYIHTVVFRALPAHLFDTNAEAYFLVDPEQLYYVDWTQTQHLPKEDETGTSIENRLNRVQDVLAHLLQLPVITACPVSFAALTYNYWGVLQAVGCPPSAAISALDNICPPGETKPPEVCEILFQLHQDAYYTPDGADRLYFEQVVNRHPCHVAVWNRLAKLVWSATQDPHRVAELLSRAANACFSDRDPIAQDWRFLGVTLAMYNQCLNRVGDGESSVPSGQVEFEQVPSHLQMRMLLLEGPDIAGPVTVAELKAFQQCKAELPSLCSLKLDVPLRQLLTGQLTTLLLLVGENISCLADPLYPVTLDALYSPKVHGMSQVTFLPQLALFRFQCELFLWCNKWKEEEVAPKSVEQGEGDEEQSSRDASPSQTESPSKPGVEGEQNLLANDSSHIDPTTRLTALQAVFEHTRTVQLPASICVTQPLLRNHHRYALDQLMFSTQSLVTTVLRYVPKKLFRVNALVNFFENHVQNLHVVEDLARTLWDGNHRKKAMYFLLMSQKHHPIVNGYHFLLRQVVRSAPESDEDDSIC